MKGKHVWPAIVLIGIAAAGFGYWCSIKDRALEVQLARVTKEDVVQRVVASGVLEAADTEEITVASGRKVVEVHVAEGDFVQAGQSLAELDTADLRLQREKLLLTLQALEADLAELDDPTKTAGTVSAQTQVAQLSLDLDLQAGNLAEAEARLEADRSQHEAGALSDRQWEDSQSTVSTLRSQMARTRASLEAARAALRDLPADRSLQVASLQNRMAQTRVELARVDLAIEESRIVAGINGQVVHFPLEAGRFSLSDTRLRIRDVSAWQVTVYLPQEEAVRVSLLQPADITVKGLTGVWSATVWDIGREAAPEAESGGTTPKVGVTLRLDGTDDRFASGYDAEAAIETGSLAGVSTIPLEALRRDADGAPYLLTVSEEKSNGQAEGNAVVMGVLQAVPVTPGLASASRLSVGDNIPAGTLVVLPPSGDAAEGVRVKGTVVP